MHDWEFDFFFLELSSNLQSSLLFLYAKFIICEPNFGPYLSETVIPKVKSVDLSVVCKNLTKGPQVTSKRPNI